MENRNRRPQRGGTSRQDDSRGKRSGNFSRKRSENTENEQENSRPGRFGNSQKRGGRSSFSNPKGKKPFGKQKRFSPEREEKSRSEAKQDLFKEGELRLNRYIANSGMCSRREADQLIEAGDVKVNGKVIKELGIRVKISDKVEVKGKSIIPEKKVYVLLNKPKGYVTTMDDPEGRNTVMDLLQNCCKERIYPVGRLDKQTTGVLLLTNDGELTKKLTHPKYNKKKLYHVFLNKALSKDDMMKIAEGFELEDGFIAADSISYVGDSKSEVGMELHSGRNRIVRRIFEHLGYDVEKLDRVYFAGLTKKGLRRGAWRFLTDREVHLLKMNVFN